jgi:hypothetical protein
MTTQQRTTAIAEPRATFPVTPRAVLIGAASVGLLAAVNPFLAFISRTWTVGSGSLMGSPLVVLFLVLLANTLVARLRPGRALQRGELVVVYGMLIIAIGLAMQGGIPYIVSATAYPIYMATPENQWQHMIWPYIPTWLRPTTMEASIWFWEGLPEKVGFPWAAWARPLLAWGGFTFALMAAVFCLGALVSKDWIERQRLAFPLVDIPLALTGDQPQPTLAGSILHNRVFWLGFAVPSTLAVLGWLHALFPSVPSLPLYDMQIGRNFAGMGLPWSVLGEMKASILFTVVGVTCLLPGEVSLSLWLFYVLFLLQLLLWASFGVAEGGQSSLAINPRTFIGFEEAGGFIALSAATLYQSRNTIRAAARSLIGRDRMEDDPLAPLTGRTALLGFVLANAFLLWFAVKAEMQWWAFAALLGMFYAVLIGAARLVAAGGVMYVDTGFFPRGVVLRTVGASALTPSTQTLFAYLSVIYMYDPMNLAMPQVMNGLKLVHSGRLRAKAFSWAAGLAVLVILAVGLPAILLTVSRPGATALGRWPFTSYPSWAFGELDATFRTPELPDDFLRLALLLGAGIVFLLVWMNSRFVWWPLSPVGFVIASSYETNRSIWTSAFIGWLIASLVRRYGGLRLYRSFRPIFIGLVLGQFLTDGALAIISSIFGIKMPAG